MERAEELGPRQRIAAERAVELGPVLAVELAAVLVVELAVARAQERAEAAGRAAV